MTQIIEHGGTLPGGIRLAATIGMFDGVHRGHATLLKALKAESEKAGLKTAVVTFREHPQNVLGKSGEPLKLIMPLSKRIDEIGRFGIDYVILLDFTVQLSLYDSTGFMRLLHDSFGVHMLMVGYNHHFGHNRSETFADYTVNGRHLGVQVLKAPEYLGEYAPVSSSIIRRLIASGKVDDAARCLGHPYTVSGTVVHGFRNGHKIGFPTANLGDIDPEIILPHNGAYAVRVRVLDKTWQGMVNVGVRPTLANGPQLSVEANIFDFDADIYGEHIEVEFVRFLRLEFKLGSIDELKRQLSTDRDTSRRLLSNDNLSQQNSL